MKDNIELRTKVKASIIRLFSQELQYDETIEAVMERNQIRKLLLDWAATEDELFVPSEEPSDHWV